MAPSVTVVATEAPEVSKIKASAKSQPSSVSADSYRVPFTNGPAAYRREIETKGSAEHPPASFPAYLPVWDNEKEKYPPLKPFTHNDIGKTSDPAFPDLFPAGSPKAAGATALTPAIGTEVPGSAVQLSSLVPSAKANADPEAEAAKARARAQLALFVAQRRVVAFRGQDFAQLPIADALRLGGSFGRHHIHPTSGAPAGFPEVHLVHIGAGEAHGGSKYFAEHTNSMTWHSDVSYEQQPPGTTFLYILDGPEAGGDTLFADMVLAYRRLSPEFRRRLHGLQAWHSGYEQASASLARGGIVRRDPVAHVHPLVREHPVTGEKALYVNSQFTRSIVGFKKEESDHLLNFLYNHIAISQDFQARVRWAPGTVVVWDNRVTTHSAQFDWENGQRRHLARITPQAEEPYETPFDESKEVNA